MVCASQMVSNFKQLCAAFVAFMGVEHRAPGHLEFPGRHRFDSLHKIEPDSDIISQDIS